MSSLPAVPAGVDLNASQQGSIKGSILATWILASLIVGLRFVSRRMSKSKLGLDDWLILPPLIFATILCFVSSIWMTDYGLGKHIWVAPEGAETVFFKSLFISELVYTGVMTFVKFSILALYFRLFQLYHIRVAVYIVAGVVTCWGIGVLLTTCLQCIPLSGFWNKSEHATCGVNDYKFFIGNAVPNIFTDIAILGIPMRPVWNLHTSRHQKIVLTLMFLMGGLVTSFSITRLVYLMNLDLKSPDFTWNFGVTQIWTCVEIHAAIVSGCLPCLRPIFAKLTPGFIHEFAQANLKSSHNYTLKSFNISTAHRDESLLKTDDYTFKSSVQDTELQAESFAAGRTHSGLDHDIHDFPKSSRQIKVQNDIDVTWHAA